MDCYLAKILELGVDESEQLNFYEKQTKNMLLQKLTSIQSVGAGDGALRKKKRRGKKDQILD